MKQGKRAVGTVFQRGQDGRWVVRFTLPSGKRLTRYAPDKAAAEQLLAKLMTDPATAAPAPYTVATWLDEYLQREAKGRQAGTVLDRNSTAKRIKKELGRVRLDKLTAAQVQHWVDHLEGAHSSRKKAVQLLRSALNQAVVLDHISRNVALAVRLERQPPSEVGKSWTREQAQTFLRHTAQHRLHNLWKLGLQTGARIGELLALRPEDYNREQKTLRIDRTVKPMLDGKQKGIGVPKTPKSRRVIRLPDDACETIEAQLLEVERLKSQTQHWQDEGWLFPAQWGTLQLNGNVRRDWIVAIKEAGLPYIRLHDMRYTFISLAAQRGLKPEVVSRIVGHASPVITLKIYRKVFDEELLESADQLEGLI